MRSTAVHHKATQVGWNQLLQDRVEALRRRVLGPEPADSRFTVDGVFFDAGVKVVVRGDITPESTPRLEAVLEGLLMLDPQEVIVEFDSAAALNAEAREWMAQREDGIVRFLTCSKLASSAT